MDSSPQLERAISQVLKRDYDLVADLSRLPGENLNYLAVCETGEKHIVKLAGDDQSESFIEMEKKANWGEFATGIAHEIRNPLATMKVCVQSLSPAVRDDQSREMLSLVLEEIDRINHLIQNLLNFARPVDPLRTRIRSSALVERIYTLALPLARERQIDLTVRTEADCILLVDEEQLQQVLMNLVLNAIEATQGPGSVMIRATAEGNQAILEVTDSGCGMTEMQLQKATQPFYTTKTEGSGLGLAISARLVQLNGGHLNIQSRQNEGTRVHMTFETEALLDD